MKKISKKKVKTLVRNNRYTVIVLCLFIILFVLLFLGYNIFFPNKGVPVYGDRLDGIEEVELKDKDLEKLVQELEAKDFVEKATVHISGRIIKPIITVKKGTKPTDAKTTSETVLAYFEKEYLDYYDIEVFIKCEDEGGYPIIGYKANDSKTFSYSSAK